MINGSNNFKNKLIKGVMICWVLTTFIVGCQYQQKPSVSEKTPDKSINTKQENTQNEKNNEADLALLNSNIRNSAVDSPISDEKCNDTYAKKIDGKCNCIAGFIQINDKCIKEAYIEVTSPENGEAYNKLPVIEIEGTISDICTTVEVEFYSNGVLLDQYQLEKFKYGDKVFHYFIKDAFQNITYGENKYLITAECDGEQLKTTSLIQYYYPSVTDEAIEKGYGFNDEDTYIEEENNNNDCDPNYSGCVPLASDVDCAGGKGDGPAYADGPVEVIGIDIYDLDDDDDGFGCDYNEP